jgi:hypothetical protein
LTRTRALSRSELCRVGAGGKIGEGGESSGGSEEPVFGLDGAILAPVVLVGLAEEKVDLDEPFRKRSHLLREPLGRRIGPGRCEAVGAL